MARLIDADELLDFVKGLKFHGGTKNRTQAGQEVLDIHVPHIVAKILTVDAVEVVHGEWEITEDDYFDLVEMKCSVCGESYGFENYEDDIPKNYHYCPNCGADMED